MIQKTGITISTAMKLGVKCSYKVHGDKVCQFKQLQLTSVDYNNGVDKDDIYDDGGAVLGCWPG